MSAIYHATERATDLPPAYPSHRHATEEFRRIAQDGMIFRSEVGSGVHGISVGGDDRDELGICIEPPAYVTGLRTFEQFERHTAWDRGGMRERSGAGDLDVTIYGLRKFCRLAAQGNPSIITLLFVPDSAVMYCDEFGRELLDHADWFVSLGVADRYLGYLHSQRRGMNGQGRVNRPELIEKHGYDTKFAAHALRLGRQGMELLSTGRIELPMNASWRLYLQSMRRGEVSYGRAMHHLDELEQRLQELRERNPRNLPAEPQWGEIDRWLHRTYTTAWGRLVLR